MNSDEQIIRILTRADELGITLSVSNGNINIKAAPGVVTPMVLQVIRANKAALIEALTAYCSVCLEIALPDSHDGLMYCAEHHPQHQAANSEQRFRSTVSSIIGIFPGGCAIHFDPPGYSIWDRALEDNPDLTHYPHGVRCQIIEHYNKYGERTKTHYKGRKAPPGRKDDTITVKRVECGSEEWQWSEEDRWWECVKCWTRYPGCVVRKKEIVPVCYPEPICAKTTAPVDWEELARKFSHHPVKRDHYLALAEKSKGMIELKKAS